MRYLNLIFNTDVTSHQYISRLYTSHILLNFNVPAWEWENNTLYCDIYFGDVLLKWGHEANLTITAVY